MLAVTCNLFAKMMINPLKPVSGNALFYVTVFKSH